MLPRTITGQLLKSVARRRAQILQHMGRIKHCKFADRYPQDIRREAFPSFSAQRLLSQSAFGILYHETIRITT